MTVLDNKPPCTPIQRQATVLFNRQIARDTFQLRFKQPEIASRILPGQFLMVRVPGRTDPLLARPYALFDTVDDTEGRPSAVDIVYLVVGNGTRSLRALKAGLDVELWGPLGNTFPTELPDGHLLIVAGGIGQTPFLAVIKQLLGLRAYGDRPLLKWPGKITLLYGARSKEYLAGVDEFAATGASVQVATNDGSAGHRGYVTDLARSVFASAFPPTAVFGCGPEPMLRSLAGMAEGGASRAAIPCWLSLENKMACGYGVCFSCVYPIHEADGWDYRRVCVEGTVFPAEQIVWEV